MIWVKLLTLLASRLVRHDATVSVAQSFTKTEIVALRDVAGLGYAAFHEHFGHRFVLAGEKTPQNVPHLISAIEPKSLGSR